MSLGLMGMVWKGADMGLMSRLKRLLCLCLLGLCPAPGIVGAEPPPLANCIRCHAHEGIQLDPGLDTRVESCQRCHRDRGMLIPVAQTSTQQPSADNRSDNPLHNDALGLSVPLYYDGSRFGDKPGEMVLIPAGPFIMGSDTRLPDEGPQHRVDLAAYYIDKYEVTNLQYKAFNDATHGRSPAHFRNRSFPPGKADHPVTFVTWEDADRYCQWAGKRLPTDQEWEKAGRGTDGRMFPWGNEFSEVNANTPLRWKRLGQFGDTTPIGGFPQGASVFGVFDMSGNVWEWTASWYQAYPNNKVSSESYGERYKTLKGGSWFDCSFYNCGISAPVFNRSFFAKKVSNDSFGFRCAKDAKAGHS